MKRIGLFVLSSLLAVAVEAHQDRILSLQPDGAIPELPASYSSTRLKVELSPKGDLSRLSLTASGGEVSLPQCLLRLVREPSMRRLLVRGSWYHNQSTLPHYISVEFRDASTPSGLPEHPGINFLFGLRDASLLSVTKIVPRPEKAAVQYQQVSLVNGCPS
jgi:hypothetical protein